MAVHDAALRVRRRDPSTSGHLVASPIAAPRVAAARVCLRHYPRPPARPQARRGAPRRAGVWLRGAGHAFSLALVGLSISIAAGCAHPNDVRRSPSVSPSAAPTQGAVLHPHESAHAQPAFDAAGSGQTVAWKPGESSPGRASGVDGAGARGAARPVRPHGLAVELTAYSASDEEGTAAGLTFTGVRARPGTVAVDPAVIPLGSRLRIAGLPGIYRAEDTGGGIRNAHVDVFMESRALALQFGRHRNVLVEILDQ